MKATIRMAVVAAALAVTQFAGTAAAADQTLVGSAGDRIRAEQRAALAACARNSLVAMRSQLATEVANGAAPGASTSVKSAR